MPVGYISSLPIHLYVIDFFIWFGNVEFEKHVTDFVCFANTNILFMYCMYFNMVLQ